MADQSTGKPDLTRTLFQQAPTIVSEMRVDYSQLTRINDAIVSTIINSDADVMTKAGLLERILPGLAAAGSCACSCSCSCSCGGDSVARSVTFTGRIQ
jgi:hypothetical protein